MLHFARVGAIFAGNEGGGSKAHVNGWLVLGILVACGIALWLGGRRD